MPRVLPYLLNTSENAADMREITAADQHKLDPIEIRGGPHKGKFALPERVIYDPNFEDRRDALRMWQQVDLNIEEAFPPEPEPEEGERSA
jgi:hypothetical protein